jgi:hypothetical protein
MSGFGDISPRETLETFRPCIGGAREFLPANNLTILTSDPYMRRQDDLAIQFSRCAGETDGGSEASKSKRNRKHHPSFG